MLSVVRAGFRSANFTRSGEGYYGRLIGLDPGEGGWGRGDGFTEIGGKIGEFFSAFSVWWSDDWSILINPLMRLAGIRLRRTTEIETLSLVHVLG